MDKLQKLMQVFSTLEPDEDGECDEKVDIIQELEEHLDDERVIPFLLNVICESSEIDMARIAALEIIQAWEAPSAEDQVRVGRRLAKALPDEEDVLVQQWMAIAAKNFSDVPEVLDTLGQLIADEGVDLDVRYNCFAAIKERRRTEPGKRILHSLVDDKEFGDKAKDILSQ